MTKSNKHHTPFFNILLGALLLFSSGMAYALPPTFSKAFSPATIGPGSISTATFTIDNSSEAIAVTGLMFTDILPTGVTVASPAMLTSDCGTPTLSAPISMSGGKVGASSSCTLTVNVTSALAGVYTNPVTTLDSSAGQSSSLATDLTVVNTLPGFSKSFSPAAVKVGARSTLTFTIDNTLNGSFSSRLTFTDNLPVGMVVASPANVSNTCPLGDVSAVPESSVVSFAEGVVLGNNACAITVDVIATGIGDLANLSGELQTNTGSAGMAGATLTVSADELIFTKSFTDDPVVPGSAATLRFDIRNTNRSNAATAIAFSDDLNAMLVGTTVASVLSDTCNGTPSGTGTFSYSGGIVAADGGACAIEISLNIPGGSAEGAYPSTSTTISASSGTFSAASETLFVFAAPVISKIFTNNPAVAGGTVTLQYTIDNPSAADPMTDISFEDELSTILGTPLSVVTTLPLVNPCGTGSGLATVPVGVSGQGLGLTGGNLPASGSCTFSVVVNIPDGAGGTYISTTDPISGVINSITRTGNQATDTLLVVGAPSFSKRFTNATVLPGGSVTLDFTLGVSGSAPGEVSNIAFSDDVATMLAGTTVNSVVGDTCGGTPTGMDSGIFGYSGSTLSPGTSCTVSILLDIDAAATPGSYTNTSSTITALANDGTTATLTVSGPEATDDLLVSGLVFSKEFINNTVLPGGTTTLRFTFDNSASLSGQDVAVLLLSDNLNDALSGLAATGLPLPVCGGTVTGTTELTFNGVTVAAGASCSVDITLDVPANASDGSYTSTTNNWFATIGGSPLIIMPSATDTLTVQTENITLSKSFTDDPLSVGGTGTLEFVIGVLANAPGTVDNISFTDDLAATLNGLTFTGGSNDCGIMLSPGSTVTVSGVSLAPGASCTITLNLAVPAGASPGVYPNSTSALTGNIGGLAVTGPAAPDSLNIRAVSLTKAFGGPSVSGGTVSLSFTIQNEDLVSGISSLAFNDDLNAAISGLVSITPPQADVCGAGSLFSGSSLLTLTNGDLGASGSCTISVTLQIPSTTAGAYLNTSGQLFSSGLVVNGPASATLTVLNTAPVNTVPPVISGSAVIDGTLNVSTGTWFDADSDLLSFSYQWKADNSDINGAIGSAYVATNAEFNTVLTVAVTANDSKGGSATVISGVSAVIDGDLDGDGTGDTVDPDIDGDGMDNDWEITNGLDPRDPNDANTDLDGDGVSNLNEFLAPSNPTIDDYAPVVTAAIDLDVNATGLYTPVATGTGTAFDDKDGSLVPNITHLNAVAVASVPTHFQPGINTLTWSATDAANNTGTADQLINVTPLVSFNQNQQAKEGDSVTVKAILNGSAAVYPVTVSYTVSGTASYPSDHGLIAGDITIASGLEGSVTVNLVNDTVTEGAENVVVTMAALSNAVEGAVNTHTIEISEVNVAPQLTLSAVQSQGQGPGSGPGQNQSNTHLVTQSGGSVVVTVTVTDSVDDSHLFDWAATDNALVDTDAQDASFSFDPSGLQPGVYTLRVAVSDGTDISESEILLNVVADAPVLTAIDTDGDGINDDVEGYGDGDGDGIPDYLDNNGLASNVIAEQSGINGSFLMETEPGLVLSLGQVAFRANGGTTDVSIDDVVNFGHDGAGTQIDQGFGYSGGLFDFTVSNMQAAGQSVRVVIPQFAAVPADTSYRKLMPAGWQYFVEDANNVLASAPGAEGICPPPGDAAYVAGLNEGDWCIQLTLEDGGPNDADGFANQSISDPGGVTQPPTNVTVNSSGGGLLSGWVLMLMALVVALRKRLVARSLLACVLIAVTGQSQAAENSLMPSYAGVSYLSVKSDDHSSAFNNEMVSQSLNVSISDTNLLRSGYLAYVGYQLNEGYALEVGYIDLGDVNIGLAGVPSDIDTFLNSPASMPTSTAKGWTVALVFSHPIANKVDLSVKAGLFAWSAENSIATNTASSSFDENGTDAFVGLALETELLPQVPVHIGWTSYRLDEVDVDAWDIGVAYLF